MNKILNFKSVKYSTSRFKKTEPKLFKKILIANRGEIALRIMRTAKQLGIKCVAVYSEADIQSQHVKMADEAIYIGPAPSSDSYLRIDKIIEAMKITGAEAVHPGYGFLSENYNFAQKLENTDFTFIGPPSSAIRSMGSKSESKQIMEKAGVPCIPGYHGDNQDHKFLFDKALEIGYPIMIKAVMGGGGKGMRVANSSQEFYEMLESAKRESEKSFGDDRVLLEKYIKRSRHIEVQIFADQFGNCVYLFERDCSIQRRNQKIIEEAPAPNISKELRRQLGEKAVAAAKAVGYVGPGTIEFIFDCADESFYFMEMNTRLQVEHPVTEMISGQDLVEWQIKVSSGFVLPLKQEDLDINGHSIEARIYAENPLKNFMPDTGKLQIYRYPKANIKLRVETGVQEGDKISIYYDPMIAKVISHGKDRTDAVRILNNALSDFMVAGLSTNISFLQKILNTNDFHMCNIDTGFIQTHNQTLFPRILEHLNLKLALASLSKLCYHKVLPRFNANNFFRIGQPATQKLTFLNTDSPITIEIKFLEEDTASIKFPTGEIIDARIIEANEKHEFRVIISNITYNVKYLYSSDNTLNVWSNILGHFKFDMEALNLMGMGVLSRRKSNNSDRKKVMPQMSCKITQILVKPGDLVKVGTPLCITEAMKMEQIIKSDQDGIVKKVHFKPGDVVSDKSLIMEIDN